MRRIREYDTKQLKLIISVAIFIVFIIILFLAFAINKGIGSKAAPNEDEYDKDSYSQIDRPQYSSKLKPDKIPYSDYGVLYTGEGDKIAVGVDSFYDTTGVCCYYEFYNDLSTYIKDTAYETVDSYVKDRYGVLFSDQEHLLIIFDDQTNNIYVTPGSDITKTIDEEATLIIKDYLLSSLTEEGKANIDYGMVFGTNLSNSAKRIMYHKLSFFEKNTLMLTILIIVSIILFLLIVFLIYVAIVTAEKDTKDN